MNYTKASAPERTRPPRCAKPNSRLSIRTAITASRFIGRPSSCTPVREQLSRCRNPVRMHFSVTTVMVYVVHTASGLFPPALFAVATEFTSKERSSSPFFFVVPFHSFSLFFTLRVVSPVFAALTQKYRGYTPPRQLPWPHASPEVRHHSSPRRSCGAILFSRLHLL